MFQRGFKMYWLLKNYFWVKVSWRPLVEHPLYTCLYEFRKSQYQGLKEESRKTEQLSCNLDKTHAASSLVLPAVCTYKYTVKKEPADKKKGPGKGWANVQRTAWLKQHTFIETMDATRIKILSSGVRFVAYFRSLLLIALPYPDRKYWGQITQSCVTQLLNRITREESVAC